MNSTGWGPSCKRVRLSWTLNYRTLTWLNPGRYCVGFLSEDIDSAVFICDVTFIPVTACHVYSLLLILKPESPLHSKKTVLWLLLRELKSSRTLGYLWAHFLSFFNTTSCPRMHDRCFSPYGRVTMWHLLSSGRWALTITSLPAHASWSSDEHPLSSLPSRRRLLWTQFSVFCRPQEARAEWDHQGQTSITGPPSPGSELDRERAEASRDGRWPDVAKGNSVSKLRLRCVLFCFLLAHFISCFQVWLFRENCESYFGSLFVLWLLILHFIASVFCFVLYGCAILSSEGANQFNWVLHLAYRGGHPW